MQASDNFKSGFAAIIGRPNVGKSTLMNRLVGQKVAITSSKPQTTRNRIQAVYTDSGGQIIFLDTPGIHKAKNKLGEYMVNAATNTLRDVDVILWLVEADGYIGTGDRHIADLLKTARTPVILVINKIDKVKKKDILRVIDAYKDLHDFAEIIPLSALTGENAECLIPGILKYMDYGPMYYDEDTITDQPERQIAAEIIREKALRNLSDEIPHGVAVSIERMRKRKDKDIMDIDATLICEKESHKKIIIGNNGSMMKLIATEARKDIEAMLGMKAYIQIWVKVKKDWRDSEYMLNNFGYRKAD